MARVARTGEIHLAMLLSRWAWRGRAFLRAKCNVNASRAGVTETRAIRDSSFERRNKLRTSEFGASKPSTCSNLNFSLQAMIGRQTIWSIRIITPTITISPQTTDRVAPALDAVCRYEPRPGRRRSLFPRTNISQTIRENQPAATDIIEFQK